MAGVQTTTPITSGSISTAGNNITITTGTFSTGGATGMLIRVVLHWTPSATQTMACKLYQGSGVSGTQVGPTAGLLATGTGTTQAGAVFVFTDVSAFAQNASGAVYTAGFTVNTGTGTIIYSHVDLETLGLVA